MTYDELQVCGGTDDIATPSGVLENGRLKWHYIEDLFGNVKEYVAGVRANYEVTNGTNFVGGTYFEISYKPTLDEDNYTICSLGWDSSNPFMCMPKELSQYDLDKYFKQIAYPSDNQNYVYSCGVDYSQNAETGMSLFTVEKIYGTPVSNGVGARLLYCPNGV